MGHKYEFRPTSAISEITQELQALATEFGQITAALEKEAMDEAAVVWAENAYTALNVIRTCAGQSRIAVSNQIAAKKKNLPNPYIKVREDSAKKAKRAKKAPLKIPPAPR